MITRYTPPKELIDEFTEDRVRARYWQKKMLNREGVHSKSFQNFKSTFFAYEKDKRSESFQYHSPKTGNDWLLWYRYIANDFGFLPEMKDYQICYQLTDQFMTIQVPTVIFNKDAKLKGVTMFTHHLFQRMCQDDRLGVKIEDRFLFIRNFVEQVMMGVVDIRDPRPGEKDMQAICRMPKSWLRGYITYIGDSYLCRFNTFYTDKSLSPAQKRDLKSFAKFADAFNSKEEMKDYFTQKEDSHYNF